MLRTHYVHYYDYQNMLVSGDATTRYTRSTHELCDNTVHSNITKQDQVSYFLCPCKYLLNATLRSVVITWFQHHHLSLSPTKVMI